MKKNVLKIQIRHRLPALSAIILAAALFGCASNQQQQGYYQQAYNPYNQPQASGGYSNGAAPQSAPVQRTMSEEKVNLYPQWVLDAIANTPEDSLIGYGTANMRTKNMSIQAATDRAQADITRQVKSVVARLATDHSQTNEVSQDASGYYMSISRSLSTATLRRAQTLAAGIDKSGDCWVVLCMPKPEIQDAIEAEAMRNRLKGPKMDSDAALRDLDKAIAAQNALEGIVTAPVIDSYEQPDGYSANYPAGTPAAYGNLVQINGGTFMMGDTSMAAPVHQVTVRSFYLSRYEVTQAEYESVMGSNPSSTRAPNMPVENVTWLDAVAYCNYLSQREGLTPVYSINGYNTTSNTNANGYRLPTEAEWEYAARSNIQTQYAGTNDPNSAGWYNANSGNRLQPAGQRQPNQFGLYDMSGNVREWCWDWFGGYSSNPQSDPLGAYSGSTRVARGGAYNASAEELRCASRGNANPVNRSAGFGFRVARSM